jgi:hypothetical protein
VAPGNGRVQAAMPSGPRPRVDQPADAAFEPVADVDQRHQSDRDAANSIANLPLLIHGVDLARRGSACAEAAGDLADARVARSYAWRQLWIVIPLAVVAILRSAWS